MGNNTQPSFGELGSYSLEIFGEVKSDDTGSLSTPIKGQNIVTKGDINNTLSLSQTPSHESLDSYSLREFGEVKK